mgnify:CR=1 FL=1
MKREASKRLKEEVIDNDRLTCANLNRIKNLEAQLQVRVGGPVRPLGGTPWASPASFVQLREDA